VLIKYPQASVHTLTPTQFEPAMNNGSEKTEYGICDECGEPSDRLIKFNNKWICEDCKEKND
jgi:formylmethanofuran dehydrogenase subunit E